MGRMFIPYGNPSAVDEILSTSIKGLVNKRLTEATVAYADTIAKEMYRTGKKKTWHMVQSIRIRTLGVGECEIRIVLYAKFVSEGHRVWNWNTSKRRYQGSDYRYFRNYARSHPLKTHGIVFGDRFLENAFTGEAHRRGMARVKQILAWGKGE